MLIDKLPFHVILNGLFLFFGVYVVLVQSPHAMRYFNLGLLLLGGCGYLVTLYIWRFVLDYEIQRRWCRASVPLAYAMLAVTFAASFGFETVGKGFVRGWLAFLLTVVGVGLISAAATVRPGLGRWLSSSIGGFSTAGGVILAQIGGGHWFTFMVFCPFIAAVCALLGVVAWRDGSE